MNYFPHYTSFKNVLENISALVKILKVDTNGDRYFQFEKFIRKGGTKEVCLQLQSNKTENSPSSSKC